MASPVALALDRYLAKTLEGSAITFDKAMDAVYAVDKTGGAYHRLFDGNHDVMGAWKAIVQAHPDNSWIENASGYLQALWKDVATPNGIPYVTLDKAKFDGIKEILHQS
ncbi:MAG: hypothetical protein OXC61_06615 [Flavobacteriaceae bacterium]|nr:hypothetical protein [Flavobacteriaceae bacterium]